MATKVPWPVKTGDTETITFVWPGAVIVGATYRCHLRAVKGAPGEPLAVANVLSAVQEVAPDLPTTPGRVAVTASLTPTQTRGLQARKTAWYDFEENAGGTVSTLFEGPVDIDLDVTV